MDRNRVVRVLNAMVAIAAVETVTGLNGRTYAASKGTRLPRRAPADSEQVAATG